MMMSETRRPKAPRRPYRAARGAAALGLFGVALLGAVNSWGSMYASALDHLAGVHLPTWHGISVAGATVPLLLDALIVVASMRYVVGVKEQRPVAGWRVAAHGAIAGTVVMNAMSARRPADVPWHIVAPAVLSLVVELTARDILGQLREVRRGPDADRIPLRLWLSAPAESVRTSWRMARTGERSAQAARLASDACSAARDALRMALPGWAHRGTRRQVTRRLWAGTISAQDVFAACGWTGDGGLAQTTPEAVLRAALRRLTEPAQDLVSQPSGMAHEPAHDLVQPSMDTPVGLVHGGPLSQPDGPDQRVNAQATAVTTPSGRPKVAVSQGAIDAVLAAVRKGQPMTKSEIVSASGGLSRSTVTRAVDHLLELDQLTAIGDPRQPSYVLSGVGHGVAQSASSGVAHDAEVAR